MFDSTLEKAVVFFYLAILAVLLYRLSMIAEAEGAAVGFAVAILSLAAGYIVERH